MLENVNHSVRKHSKLSASASSRWLNCPGSIEAEKEYEDTTSSYAEEGTLAHELANLCLLNGQKAEFYVDKKIQENSIAIDISMAGYVQEYLDYIGRFLSKQKVYIERKVYFSHVVPDGYGTLDAALVDEKEGICHIFDLKYGKGVQVSPVNNSQLKLYALGIYKEFPENIRKVCVHIVQPRLGNFESDTLTVNQLLTFEKLVEEKARLALSKNAPRFAGDHCQWCKAKADCPVLAKYSDDLIYEKLNEENLPSVNLTAKELTYINLTIEQKRKILDNKKLIEGFLKAIEKSVFQTIASGNSFPGYKIVEGRSNRKWREEAGNLLYQKIGEEAYETSLIGIVKAEKLLKKEEVNELTFKPEGKPTLVKESDKRESISFQVDNPFDMLES